MSESSFNQRSFSSERFSSTKGHYSHIKCDSVVELSLVHIPSTSSTQSPSITSPSSVNQPTSPVDGQSPRHLGNRIQSKSPQQAPSSPSRTNSPVLTSSVNSPTPPSSPAKPRSPSPPVRIHSGSPTSGLSKQVYYPTRSPQRQPSPEPPRSPQSSDLVSSSSPKVRFGLYQTTSPGMRANPVIQRSFKKPASAVTVVKKKPDTAEDQFKRKQVPDWARGEQLKDAIRRQYEAEINYVVK